jgi:putative membrane protein
MLCGGFGSVGNGLFPLMMGIRMLIIIAIIVVGIKLFNKYTDNSKSALRILDEKFAKGEINEDDYISRKNVLLKK